MFFPAKLGRKESGCGFERRPKFFSRSVGQNQSRDRTQLDRYHQKNNRDIESLAGRLKSAPENGSSQPPPPPSGKKKTSRRVRQTSWRRRMKATRSPRPVPTNPPGFPC